MAHYEQEQEPIIGGGSLYGEEHRVEQRLLRKRGEEAARMAFQEKDSIPELRVLIADDQELVRNGFRLILSSYEGIKVVGEAQNGEEAVACALSLKPNVVLMDIRMPGKNGIDATREITQSDLLSNTHVLILTTFDIDEYVYDALAAGASGFLLKDSEPDDIAAAIKVIARGEALIQPSITKRLIESFVGTRRKVNVEADMLTLTEREREILVIIAQGLTNDEIAQELVISPATVKTHVARIMAKLKLHDRAQLVIFAYENGLVVPNG